MANHHRLTYDFIVCGAGSSGSVVAGRLAENPDVSVLLLEAGGSDEFPEVAEPGKWPSNLASDRAWPFRSLPDPNLGGRSVDLAMGKVLGGGSSINVMAWLRGHKEDWDYFAAETHDSAWSYQSVLGIYRRIEDWCGPADSQYRGAGGPVHIEPVENPSPLAPAMLDAAATVGIPKFKSHNGQMMESDGGCALTELIIHGGKRQSIYRSYVYPKLQQPNLTVLTGALVTRVLFAGKRATEVEAMLDNRLVQFQASKEIILSTGAIHTPKVLMQSGIGDVNELKRHAISAIQHLPGVGQNLQDHASLDLAWEYRDAPEPRNNLSEAILLWKSQVGLTAPDILAAQVEIAKTDRQPGSAANPPLNCWGFKVGLLQPKSRGRVLITGPRADHPVNISAGYFSDPDDCRVARAGLELCQEIARAAPLARYVKQQVVPPEPFGISAFMRENVATFHHQTCTAKMGRDADSVVDGQLRVYGTEALRIADGSVFPRIPRANTMAPCVVVGERAADLLKAQHGI